MLLSQLQKAFEPLTQLSQAEAIVDVAGTAVHLRLLSPDEELECQQESQSFISDLEEDAEDNLARTKAIQFLDAFRMAVLSRAMVQISDNDLRTTTVIETGETLDNGVTVKITKVQAVRTILEGFPRSIQVRLMQEYHILTESVSKVVEKAIIGEYNSAEAEIEDLEAKIQEIKQTQKGKESAVDEDVRKKMRTATTVSEGFTEQRLNTAKDLETKIQEAAKAENAPAEDQQFDSQVEQEAPKVRQPIRPQSAPPPQKKEVAENPPPVEVAKTKPPEPNIYQEQQMPQRQQPQGLKQGVDVYRLPPSEIGGGEVTVQQKTAPQSSRNPRFRSPKN